MFLLVLGRMLIVSQLIMKNKGELNPENKKDALIPGSFIEFMLGKIKEESKENSKTSEVNNDKSKTTEGSGV